MINDYSEYSDESLDNILSSVNEEIAEWQEQDVYPGDQGYQDMLQQRDAIMEEQEKRMQVQDLADRITQWEMDHGESFTDYFMHDSTDDKEWGEFLVSKGFEERGKAIIEVADEHEAKGEFLCQSQQFLYDVNQFPEFEADTNWKGLKDYDIVYDEAGMTDENYDKDCLLWAEFLTIDSLRAHKVEVFLTND